MIAGPSLKKVRHRLGLSLREASQQAGVHVSTWCRWENTPILSRCQELKVARVLWRAARERSYQDICPTCHMGYVPRPDAPTPLPRIGQIVP